MVRRIVTFFFLSTALAAPVLCQKAVDADKVSNPTVTADKVSVPKGKSREEELFREALSWERDYRDYYVLINQTQKMVKVEDLTSICEQYGYLYREDYVTKDIDRFGDKAATVLKFWFLPKASYWRYVFEWTDRTSTKSESLEAKGSVWFFDVTQYNLSNKLSLLRDCYWSGNVVDGFIDGTGAGICQLNDESFCYFSGQFRKGFPLGRACFRKFVTKGTWGYGPKEKLPDGSKSNGAAFHWIEVGQMSDGMATFRYLDNGGDRAGKTSDLYGFVNENGLVAIAPTYKEVHNFSDGKAAVRNNKGEGVYIDKVGQFVDYTEEQKIIFADAKAEEERIKAEAEQQRLLAEQKAEEERKLAEEKRLAYLQKIQPLMDKNKWQIGDRLCLEFARQGQYITGTLEGWNPDRSKCKLMIVTSPGARVRYNGYNLEKNSLVWIPSSGDGWHKALPEELEAANRDDNSTYTNTISTLAKCPECNGKGYVEYTYTGWFGSTGKGTRTCSRCEGTKFVMQDQKLF